MPIRVRVCDLEVITLDFTLDYDGSDFYGDDTKDHKVDIPGDQILVVDKATGEIKTTRE